MPRAGLLLGSRQKEKLPQWYLERSGSAWLDEPGISSRETQTSASSGMQTYLSVS